MKFTIPQYNLAALIARGGAVSVKNSTIDVLMNVRIIATDGRISLASCDHDRFAEAHTTAEVERSGAVTVDAAAFKTLIGKHPKTGNITVEDIDGRVVVSCNRSKVKLSTQPVEDFPGWSTEEPSAQFEMAGKDFDRAFNRVRAAASTEQSRYYLCGVVLDAIDDKLHFAATDGHRLAVSGMKAPTGAETCPRVIVPTEAVDAALDVFKGVDSLKVAVGTKSISFEADNLRLCCKLIDGIFPDYTRVIPERGQPAMTIRRADFVDCLDRANVLAEAKGAFSGIVARPDGDALRLESRNQKGGEAHEELSAVIADNFKPFAFNPRYAASFLAALNVGELTIEQGDPDGPHLILSDDAPDFLGVLMPLRIPA